MILGYPNFRKPSNIYVLITGSFVNERPFRRFTQQHGSPFPIVNGWLMWGYLVIPRSSQVLDLLSNQIYGPASKYIQHLSQADWLYSWEQ
jgi:hypothetical protein